MALLNDWVHFYMAFTYLKINTLKDKSFGQSMLEVNKTQQNKQYSLLYYTGETDVPN